MTERRATSESQPLLSPRISLRHQARNRKSPYCSLRHLCPSSKATILLLVWTVLEGAAYQIVVYASIWFLFLDVFGTYIYLLFIFYLLMAIVYLVYPISGFLADAYCG